MYRDAYSTAKYPPCPVVRGFRVFSTPLNWEQTFVEALVDTGSDVSFLPAHLFLSLMNASDACRRLAIYDQMEVSGITGKQSDVPLFLLQYEIPGLRVKAEAAFLLLGSQALLGRNILNRYRVILDGILKGDNEMPTLAVTTV